MVNKNDKNFSSYKGAIYNKKGDTLMYLALYAKQAEVKPSCESILTSAFTNDLGDSGCVLQCTRISGYGCSGGSD